MLQLTVIFMKVGGVEMWSDAWHFENFELDANAYMLSRRGKIVRLERIPLELLCLLVERRGQIVTRDEILERIWGKRVFIDSEHAINTAVRKIRRALDDDAAAPRFIVTMLGKGYRFVARVVILNGTVKKQTNSEPPSNRESAEFGISPVTLAGLGERRHLTVLFCDL